MDRARQNKDIVAGPTSALAKVLIVAPVSIVVKKVEGPVNRVHCNYETETAVVRASARGCFRWVHKSVDNVAMNCESSKSTLIMDLSCWRGEGGR